MRRILIVPVGVVDEALTSYLSLFLAERLEAEVSVAPEPLLADFAYDPVRRQHHSTKILDALARGREESGQKILGVIDADLHIPILTFVFGEAHLGGPAATFSLTRLRPTFYGLPEDSELFYHRAEKEALHELGHAFGLVHCASFDCAMHFSSGVEEVDLKGDDFCEDCRRRLDGGGPAPKPPRG
ncbi:MAG: archaemetzincin family Zn-dependent metalloprotease, partial [Candidatus Eisenbacteria bacterium]|nr:archaemetzincin family Zn-dependent metalloprotease [Candidatus Eisenbacteria bacterium]